ncbi:MAG: ATP-binding protein, partial [Polyangiales bacterium]
MLHGREPELAAIDALIASARAGRGRAMFVTGEAGLGKSTLLGEAATRAGGVVLAGGAWESPGAPPYWPWIQVMRAATTRFGARVQDLPGVQAIENLATGPAHDTTDPAAARFALLDALSRTLIGLSLEEPLVIVIDDLHAADNPSLELLELLCREIPRAAIAIFGGWREAELALRPDAARRLARASRHATIHSLRRLTAAEVTAWIGADGPAIHGTSEGNPLFVEELVR